MEGIRVDNGERENGEMERRRVERENKTLRGELKNMNEKLNLIFSHFDSTDFEPKKERVKRAAKAGGGARAKSTYSEEGRNIDKLVASLA